MKHFFACLFVFCVNSSTAQDRPIGQVGGKPVMASQVQAADESKRVGLVYKLIIRPAVEAYLESHRNRWEATEEDKQRFMLALREHEKCLKAGEQRTSPEQQRAQAEWTVPQLKLQRFIYERHGGGRLRFQQIGTEAFDANRQMLLDLERQGAFAINDPALRDQALGYWLEPHGPLMADPGIDKAFKIEEQFPPCPSR
jgi:hypothetical protein